MICIYILNCREISSLWINKIPYKKKMVSKWWEVGDFTFLE